MPRSAGYMGLIKGAAAGALALTLAFNAVAGIDAMGGAPQPAPDESASDAFSAIWGHDLTGEAFAHDGVPGLFRPENFSFQARDLYNRHVAQMRDPEKRQIVYEFLQTLEQHRGKPLDAMIRAVDGAIDGHVSYSFDEDLYQKDDHWATPYEVLTAQAGDCEDYALLKYFALGHLGVSDAAMRVVLLSQGKSYGHANLLIEGEGGQLYFLDNDNTGRLIHEGQYFGALESLFNYGPAGADMVGVRYRQIDYDSTADFEQAPQSLVQQMINSQSEYELSLSSVAIMLGAATIMVAADSAARRQNPAAPKNEFAFNG